MLYYWELEMNNNNKTYCSFHDLEELLFYVTIMFRTVIKKSALQL